MVWSKRMPMAASCCRIGTPPRWCRLIRLGKIGNDRRTARRRADPSTRRHQMTTPTNEPLGDDELETTAGGSDAVPSGDADGTDGGDADGTDGGDADGTDGDSTDTTDGDAS